MHAQAKRRLVGLAVVASIAAIGLVAPAIGCSLGLDPSLIGADAAVDGLESDGPLGDAPSDAPSDTRHADGPADAAADALPPPGAGAGACSTDADCKAAVGDAAAGCVTSAKCDPIWHVCMLDVCPAPACQAEVCVTSTDTCSLPATYHFQPGAGSFPVTYGGVGPPGPGGSIAAVWPFVFVVTTNGVIAYEVVDPTSGSPTVVPVHGVPFIPDATIAVGRRVYFVKGPEGGPTFHYAIAWVDVPQNPFLQAFQASSAWVSGTTKSFNSVLTNGVDGLFFVYNPADQLWDSANLHPPLSDSTVITTQPNANFPMNAFIWGSSGSRLFTGRYDGTAYGYWGSLVTAIGTTTAQATAEQMIGAGLGEIANQAYVTTGGDGSVLASVAPYAMTDAGPTGIESTCLTWLIDPSSTGNFDATMCATLETYPTPPGGTVVGRPAWVDAHTALGLAGAASNPAATTSVHVVKKGSVAVVAGQVAALPVGPTSVGIATSNGFGYALAQDDPMNQTCTVYIFAPGCM